MNIAMKVIYDINNLKKKLIEKAKEKGMYENFGQKEVRKLEDKYRDCEYREREAWDCIRKFDNWCMNFDLSDLRGL